MQQLLLRHPNQHIQRAPTLRRLLETADIQDPVVEVIVHFLVGLFPQERFICVHCVAG